MLQTTQVNLRQTTTLTMASGVYAIANIGNFQLFVSDTNNIKSAWPPLMEMLKSGKHPHAALQKEWEEKGEQRYFTFHTRKEIAGNTAIIGIEQLDENSIKSSL